MDKNAKIYVSGHTGLVGSSLLSKLQSEGYNNIITISHKYLDLTNQNETYWFFRQEKPEYVFMCAATVGGIKSNISSPVKFLYDNMMIEFNIIRCSFQNYVKKLIYIGSNCMYPKDITTPINEEYLLKGELEPTNEAFALAKISGLKLCQYYNEQYKTNYISTIPCNVYGIGDNFDLEKSHVISALIRKIHEAKINNQSSVEIWGSGKPKREFIYNEDLSDALLFLMKNNICPEVINIGTGEDYEIFEIAEIIKEIIGYNGNLIYNLEKPDGVYRKLLDNSKITSLGWKPKISLKEGLKNVYEWYSKNN